jgi:hypothetical protein
MAASFTAITNARDNLKPWLKILRERIRKASE